MKVRGVNSTLRKQFGDNFRALRLASGVSQEAFADKCGFARSYVSRIERGSANPSLDAIEALALALGVEVVCFFELIRTPVHLPNPKVPFAKDGSFFSPTTFRPTTGEFNVGGKGKGNVVRFTKFEDALAYLKAMPEARWWRPNESGNWGLVVAVRWGVLPTE
jgi:transcriptional regulator with XRE-family HTH domain